MDEGSEPGTGSTRTGGQARGRGLSPQQQAHQDAFDRLREEVRVLHAAAEGKRETREFDAALRQLIEGADELCDEAEAMPARLDEEDQARSRQLVRWSGIADLVLVGVLVALIVVGQLSRGWSVGVVLLVAAAAGLFMVHVAPPGAAHRVQRTVALVSPGLGLLGVLLLVLTSWWWSAPLMLFGFAWVVALAVSDSVGLAGQSSRTGWSGRARAGAGS